ncbi:Hypothetical_protein [Hexamita inflata]|uniref:Hypothetical_protein n=1 Tax=Hexamita inflata TaxID=28002 RepID=A0AA86RH03_9EUKA|nr:Hypothetical protein HINF_LOCUS64002 [Hexamita inflata]
MPNYIYIINILSHSPHNNFEHLSNLRFHLQHVRSLNQILKVLGDLIIHLNLLYTFKLLERCVVFRVQFLVQGPQNGSVSGKINRREVQVLELFRLEFVQKVIQLEFLLVNSCLN